MELTGPKLCKTVKFWHAPAKEILIDAWNNTRPTNCVVGETKFIATNATYYLNYSASFRAKFRC